MSALAVTLTIDELRALVRDAVREAGPGAASGRASSLGLTDVLTREQAATMLHVHPNVLTRWVRDRGVPGHKIGGEWRFLRAEIMTWITSQKKDGG